MSRLTKRILWMIGEGTVFVVAVLIEAIGSAGGVVGLVRRRLAARAVARARSRSGHRRYRGDERTLTLDGHALADDVEAALRDLRERAA